MTIERRDCRQRRPTLATRADGKKIIQGYAAVFYRADDPGTEYQLWAGLRERIMPGAFDRALKEQHDVRALFNHETSALLGRSASNTLRLSIDQVGLRYEIDAGDTQLHRDLAELIGRGDVDGSSFGFAARKVSYTTFDEQTDIRGIEDVELYDVGPVTYPAYTGTSASVRSAEPIAECRDEWEAWRAQHRANHDQTAVEVRLALLRLDD